MAQDEYVTLMASLPALGPILVAKHAPINGVRLMARLKQLRPEHFAELIKVGELLSWTRLPLSGTDPELVRRARSEIPTLNSLTLADIARDRMEMRTLVAALRRRHVGEDAPAADIVWGYGRFVHRIASAWREPDFGLTRSFPWVNAARECLEKQDSRGLERILLEQAWRLADRVAGGHMFNFEAVALYVVRWHLLYRWTQYDAEAAAARFGELVAEALDAAADLQNEHIELTEAVS